MRTTDQDISRLRYATWPLLGFVLGAFAMPIQGQVRSLGDRWIIEFLGGMVLGFAGLIAALVLNRYQKRTRTVLPFYNASLGQNWAFAIGLGFCLIGRSLNIGGVIPIVLSAIPILAICSAPRQKSFAPDEALSAERLALSGGAVSSEVSVEQPPRRSIMKTVTAPHAVVAVILLVAGAASGVWAERQRIFGYRSYADCMIHEVKKAGDQAQFLQNILEAECDAQTNALVPSQ